ncbi:MAG: hypothetical protein ACI8SJ_000105 [Shewanella sp.]|jgi:hypothetical protein
MAQVITIAGEKLFAAKAQVNQQLDIDTFIFAYVPGQDPNAPINREEGLPPVGQQVHTQAVQQVGRINDNVVVYSTVLDSVTGTFDFNWVGLYSSANQTLIAISKVPTVTKTVTVPGSAGNTLNRNFGIEYSGLAELAGISVAPETWQLDFTARLSGMDELTRQLAADMNGKDWFIEDGFKVVPRATANSFSVTPGAGYVSGLRIELKQEHILTLQSYPQFVYVDAWFDGNASSKWAPQTAFTVTANEMDDYIDVNGAQHYVFKLAVVSATTYVEDLRSTTGLRQEIEKHIKEPDEAHFASAIVVEQTGNTLADEFKVEGRDYSVKGTIENLCSVVLISDSIGESVGASSYSEGYANKLMRSLMNHVDMGAGNDRGYGHAVTINMERALQQPGLSTSGELVSLGVVDSRLRLNSGQSITIINKAIAYADIFYQADKSSGEIQIALDGKVIKQQAVNGNGVQTTFPTALNDMVGYAQEITEQQVVTITAIGGVIEVCGIKHFKHSYKSPIAYTIAKSGWGYQNYSTPEKLDEIAGYANWARSSEKKLFIINLGTNNIYNPTVAGSPAEYVTNMIKLVNGIKSRCLNSKFLISVPPKANESQWPIVDDVYRYEDYVKAISKYCIANKHGLIRHDRSTLSEAIYYSDGVHPNDEGHSVMAATICDALAIATSFYEKIDIYADPSTLFNMRMEIPLNDFSGGGDIKFIDLSIDDKRLKSYKIRNNDSDKMVSAESIQSGNSGIYWVQSNDSGNKIRLFYSVSGGVAPASGPMSAYIDNTSTNVTVIIEYK